MNIRDNLRIIEKTLLSDDWAILTRYKIGWKRRDGKESVGFRQTYDRGNGSALLPYNLERRTVLLTRQFRLPAYVNGYDSLLVEVAAGRLDAEDPEACVRKEAEEELGLKIGSVTQVFNVFMSPGSVTERLHLYVAPYDANDRVSQGGGLEEEGEDIEVLEMTIDAAIAQMDDGTICDAKTVILLQYAAMHLFAD